MRNCGKESDGRCVCSSLHCSYHRARTNSILQSGRVGNGLLEEPPAKRARCQLAPRDSTCMGTDKPHLQLNQQVYRHPLIQLLKKLPSLVPSPSSIQPRTSRYTSCHTEPNNARSAPSSLHSPETYLLTRSASRHFSMCGPCSMSSGASNCDTTCSMCSCLEYSWPLSLSNFTTDQFGQALCHTSVEPHSELLVEVHGAMLSIIGVEGYRIAGTITATSTGVMPDFPPCRPGTEEAAMTDEEKERYFRRSVSSCCMVFRPH